MKFGDYAAHGVGRYWSVDPGAESIEQFLLRVGKYPRGNRRWKTGQLTSPVISGLTLPVRIAFHDQNYFAILRRLLAWPWGRPSARFPVVPGSWCLER